MLRTKKIITLVLAFTLMMASFAVWRAPVSAYSGYTYTDNADIAAKLDRVLNGTAKIFNNTNTTYAVGDSINNSFAYTWGNYNTWGYQCLAYARAVYFYLFGEDADYAGGSYPRSYLAISPSDGVSKLSYDVLADAGVGCGAYVRTTANYDYSYNTSNGHSFLILSYDEDTMTFLEGNANCAGLIALNTYTFEQFNRQRLSNAGRRISFVIQPNVTKRGVAYDSLQAVTTTVPVQTTQAPVTTTMPATTSEPLTFDIASLLAVPGDVDGSGHVDSSDARTALRTAVGLENFDEDTAEFRVLDINSDGEISADDARLILRVSVGLPLN